VPSLPDYRGRVPGDPIDDLGLALPVLAAPMAGGPTTVELVLAAADAGALGFVAGGYRSPDELAAQVAAVSGRTASYAVNLFAPAPLPVDPAEYAAYREVLLPLADRLEVELPVEPIEDDDHWRAKVDVLAVARPPVVSFTFGLPDPATVGALHRAGCALLQTVTTVEEARLATDAGLDGLVVQGAAAGGHSGTFTPVQPIVERPLASLVRDVRAVSRLPVVAAGGLVRPDDVAATIAAGAAAVAVGTALLLAPEAGTSGANRLALRDPGRGPTRFTRAFTGRPARGVPNAFMDAYDDLAPLGYPALHHLTTPIRRASAAPGDCEQVNTWAGTGFGEILDQPAATTLRALAARL
jgi:NAD(P)H-dependent flavin oxidoreductase YrpB (nitropropane dioxygenase family)